MPATYPLDLSGNSPANLINSELHSVSESHFRDYYFIVPLCAPFYVDNLVVKHTYNNVTRILTEDVEYSLTLPYITGTRTTGKPMYGAFTINDTTLNGILSITYQTLGGDQIADRLYVLNFLVEKAYNPRTTVWDVVTNVPVALPPTPHYQDYDQFYGQEEVVGQLNAIKDAILTNSHNTATILSGFFTGINPTLGSYLNKLGDTMLGPLVLVSDPMSDLEPTTKQYVDTYKTFNDISVNGKVNKVGDTMTGFLTLNATPTAANHAATKAYVDLRLLRSGGTMTGALTLSDTPTAALHAATKAYVDAQILILRNMIDDLLASTKLN